ncbi:hypothetical protein MMC07_009354 [Pseudocyphellaria aurata]|nr:hypothetical protein [Pseudocyphellaria aurata]
MTGNQDHSPAVSETLHSVTGDTIMPSNDGYVLNRDYAASTRLNCQFFLWKMELGFNLHPSIPVLSTGCRVADLGTGTAIWLLDLERSLPNSRLDGFDISLQQCPPAAMLPASMSLHQWDIFTPVPIHLKMQYNIVHIRLALLYIPNNDPRSIFLNIMEMLKPGGYLQWDELSVFDEYVVGTGIAAGTKPVSRARPDKFERFEWVQQLRGIAEQCGFEEAREFKYENFCLARYFQDTHLMALREEITHATNDAEREKLEKTFALTIEESKNGIARCTPKLVIVARKPI